MAVRMAIFRQVSCPSTSASGLRSAYPRFRYFVRVAGSYRNKEEDIKRIFGKVEVVELYGMDEFAVLTAEMSEGEFKAAAVAYDSAEQARSDYGIKQMIRAMI